jgi:tetratricopeptide (TPR) repeat protein
VVLLAGLLACGGWAALSRARAGRQLRQAAEALDRRHFRLALGQFEAYLADRPHDAGACLGAARAARRAGLFARAEEHLGRCERDGATDETALERALLRAQQGDLAGVEGPLTEHCLAGHPDTVVILEALAQGYIQCYRLGDAFGCVKRLLELCPEHARAFSWRGAIYEGAARGADAVRDYQRAVELEPGADDLRLRLAEALVGSHRPAEAWPHLQELLGREPADPAVLLAAARCQRGQGRPAETHALLEKLLASDPDHVNALFEQGKLLHDEGRLGAAAAALGRAARLQPTRYPIGYALHRVLQAQGRTAEAAALRQRLDRLRADEERLRALARQIYEKPQRAAAWRYEAGRICQRNGATDEALRWFLGAVQDDPGHGPTHRALAELYDKSGNAAAAEEHRRLAAAVP